MGLVTLLIFPLLAWGLTLILSNFIKISPIHLLKVNTSVFFMISLFLSVGILFGLFVIWLTELNYFEKSMSKYKDLLSHYKLTTFYVIFLSICAGVGEEIFFRGFLQPLIGVWLTAIFFVLIHGYFSIKNQRINLFAILLTLFIVIIGYGAQNYSIWVAIAAHFSYDLILLFYYKKNQKSKL